MDEQITVGIVRERRFIVLPAREELRLTRIDMQAAISPTAGEIDLAPYEGSLLAVEGRPSGEWLYSANVVDRAGKTIAAAVAAIFEGAADEDDASRAPGKGKKRGRDDAAMRKAPGVSVEEGLPDAESARE